MLLIAALSSATAHAAGGSIGETLPEVPPPRPTLEFTTRASDGYRLTVGGDVGERGAGAVALFAERPGVSIEYRGRGRVTKHGIWASFGRLGAVEVRFHPSGKVRRVRLSRRCNYAQRHVRARLGAFVGVIRFRGERGYTEAAAGRAGGGIGSPLAIVPEPCEPSREKLQPVSLEARARGPEFSFSAEANSPWPHQRPRFFEVASFEEKKPIPVARLVWATGPDADFVWNEALTSASVTPPPPFSGTGSLQAGADGSSSWTGSLSAQIPGLGKVPLTGPRFKPSLWEPRLFG